MSSSEMQSSSALWNEFKEQFMAKLYSAEFQTTYDDNLRTSTATPKSLTKGKPKPPGPAVAKLGKTFQRRSSLGSNGLRAQITEGVLTTPVHQTGPSGPSFFMTETPNGHDDSAPQMSRLAPVPSSDPSSLPPAAPQTAKKANSKSALRQGIETRLRAAVNEKNHRIPVQYRELSALLNRLQRSREEQVAFLKEVKGTVKRRMTNAENDLVALNKEMVSTLTRENKMKVTAEFSKTRDERISAAAITLHDTAKKRKQYLEVKMKHREVMKQKVLEEAENLERKKLWLTMIKLATYGGHCEDTLKPKFEQLKTEGYLKAREKTLADKIVGMWKQKQAPTEGKKYRACVMKLRSFIKKKSVDWKHAQKSRAMDTCVQFLRDHKRANLPIVVANFIYGVKIWQRWWRSFEQATANRVKALMAAWDEIETEWFAEKEAEMHEDAEKKKRMEEEFDLNQLFEKKGRKMPSYSKGKRPGSVRTKFLGHPKIGPPPSLSPKRPSSTRSPTGSPTKGCPVSPTKGKLNVAQTSVIIDMRLQKDLQALRERKPSGHVKRELLRQKLREIRYRYKMGAPNLVKLMDRDDVYALKVNTVNDVKLMLRGPIAVKELGGAAAGSRKKKKYPVSSKCIHLFTGFVNRDVMKGWVAEACEAQELIIQARQQNLIDMAAGKVPTAVIQGDSSSEEESCDEEFTPSTPRHITPMQSSPLTETRSLGEEKEKEKRKARKSRKTSCPKMERRVVGGGNMGGEIVMAGLETKKDYFGSSNKGGGEKESGGREVEGGMANTAAAAAAEAMGGGDGRNSAGRSPRMSRATLRKSAEKTDAVGKMAPPQHRGHQRHGQRRGQVSSITLITQLSQLTQLKKFHSGSQSPNTTSKTLNEGHGGPNHGPG